MKRTIVIDEEKERRLIENIFESVFYPNATQVIEVEKFLNNHFRKKIIPTINDKTGDADLGYSFIYSKNGIDLQQMKDYEVVRMLDDEFHDRIKDDDDRKRFLYQVLNDWVHNRIKNGILSVNHL